LRKNKNKGDNRIFVSHFVGLSGIGGVQRNFAEYFNNQIKLESRLLHKVYTLGSVDAQYKIPVKIYDIRKLKNLLSLVLDIISRNRVVHFYNNLTSLKVVVLLFLLPVHKLIIHERGTIWNFPSSRRVLLRFVVWKTKIVLVNSNATKVMLEKKFHISSEKIRVLHNGIDTKIKCVEKKEIYNKSALFRIGFIGRLDTPKGVHVLIDAMHNLVENSNIKLYIAGDGPLEDALKTRASNLKNIFFIGRIESPYNFLRDLDLLVVPSIREPLGNVCLEAGLCKVPVLAASVDGIPEIIENKASGELIIPTQTITFVPQKNAIDFPEYIINPLTKEISRPKQINPQILAKKIITLSNSPGLLKKYGEQLYIKVVTYFNMDRYTKELNEIYFDISNDN